MKETLFRRIAAAVVVLAMALSMASCGVLDLEKLFSGTTKPADPPPATCYHSFDAEDQLVKRDGVYYFVNTCAVCGEDVAEMANVVKASDKLVYDETSHWNIVEIKEEGATANYKANNAAHDFDESGVCKACLYRNTYSEGLEYALSDDGEGYIVVGMGDCTDAHINIPPEYNGLPVIGIGDDAFADTVADEGGVAAVSADIVAVDKEDLRVVGITIPDTVINISCKAFAKCQELANFIVDVANDIFKSTDNCLINTVTNTLVRGCEFSVIPEDGSVTVVGAYAFAGVSGLVSITIPDAVGDIEEKAFFECDALVEVYMPENVNLGVDVFRGSIHVEINVTHALELVPAKEATCEAAGNVEYYVCTDCGFMYADAEAKERIYEVTIAPAHDFVDGKCTKCGKVQDEVLIVSIDDIPDLGKFPLGTLESAIGLPASVNAYTKDGTLHQLEVKWDLSGYDKSEAGKYVIKGIVQPGDLYFAEEVSNVIEASIEILDIMNGTADVVFVLDISGSMGDEIYNVKENIIAFAQAIEAKGVSARWGAITYSDFTVSGPNEDSVIIKNGASDWFVSAEEYKKAINAIDLAYGGDGPETAIDGLMLANTMTTRSDARVFYILLTDADCKITNNYGVTSIYDCANILADKGINTSVITDTYYYSEYGALTNYTGGIRANIYDDFSADLLEKLVPIIYGEVMD